MTEPLSTPEQPWLFEDWIAELNAEAIRKGYRSPHPVSDGCEEDWRLYYDDGYSPKDALEADEMP
jgi:hypothetical protein